MKKLLHLLFACFFLAAFHAEAQTPVVTRIEPNEVNLGHLVKIYGRNLGNIQSINFGPNTQFSEYPVRVLNDTTLQIVVRGNGATWSLSAGNLTVATTNLFTYNSSLPSGGAGNGIFCNGIGGFTRVRILGTDFDTGDLPYCISGSPKFFNNITTTLKSDTTYQVEIFYSSPAGINISADFNRDGDSDDFLEYTPATVLNSVGSRIVSFSIPQHTASTNIPLTISHSATTNPGAGNTSTATWSFRLSILGTVSGPGVCYSSLLGNCPPANLQIDSVDFSNGPKTKIAPCTGSRYMLFKRAPRPLEFIRGRSYSLNIKQSGTAPASARAWLDVNRVGNLNLLTLFRSTNLSQPPLQNTFTIPLADETVLRPYGSTRLRIRLDAGITLPNDPCTSNATSSQTLDYIVQIVEPIRNNCTPALANNTCNGTNGLSEFSIDGTSVSTALACQAQNPNYQFLPHGIETEDNLTKGQNYTFRFRAQFAGSVGLWADWDGDGNLEPHELAGSLAGTVAGTSQSFTFTVPLNAIASRVMFRIRTLPGASIESQQSCLSLIGSMTYDFTMVLQEGQAGNPPSYCAQIQNNTCTPLINNIRIKGTSFQVSPSCAGGAYQNLPASGSSTGIIQEGQDYILSWSGQTGVKTMLWVDWNANGVFEENEAQVGSGQTYLLRRDLRFDETSTIRVRLRASANQALKANEACLQRSEGLTIDFTLSTPPNAVCKTNLHAPSSEPCPSNVGAMRVGEIWRIVTQFDQYVFRIFCPMINNRYLNLKDRTTFEWDSTNKSLTFYVESPNVQNQRAQMYVWADWNGNGIFEASEYYTTEDVTGTEQRIWRARPPLHGFGKMVRVRARTILGSTPVPATAACSTFATGMTLDFILDVGLPIRLCNGVSRSCSTAKTNYIERVYANEIPLFGASKLCVSPYFYDMRYAFGDPVVKAKPGESFELKVNLNTPVGTSRVVALVDWNGDKLFSANEFIELTGNSLSQYSKIITVPTGTASRTIRFMIRHVENSTPNFGPNSPCGNYGNGSDADFLLQIYEDCPAKPTIQTPQGTVVCPGGAVQLSVNANGNQVRWSNGQTTANIGVFTPGIYRVALLNSVCLSDSSDPVVVTAGTVPPQPGITAPLTSICQGDSALLTGPAGFTTYQWSNGGPNRQFIWVKTNSTITLRVSNGCISAASAPVTVTVSTPPPPATTTPTGSVSVCTGDSVLLSAPAGFQYLWSTGQTSRTIWAKNLGVNYTVRLISGACTSAVSPVVSLEFLPKPPTPVITSTGNLTFCSGDSVRLSAPTGFSYQWSNGASTREIWVKQSGSFSVRTFLVAGCLSAVSNSISVTVNPSPPRPTISPAGPIGICQGDSVRLLAVAGGVLPTLWSTGATTPFLWVKTAGSYTARTILNGCTSLVSEPKVVTVSPKPTRPTITVQGNPSFCQGDSVQLTAVFSGNGVQWNTGSSNTSIWVKQTGVYYVNAFVNAECQSDTSLPVSISSRPKPKPVQITRPASTSICAGDSVLLQAPAGFASYRWSNGRTSASIYAKTAGRYSVQVAGANGCFSDTLGFFTSGLYFFPAGATDGDSIHIFLNPGLTCPLPAQNPGTSMQGTSIARLHSGVTLNGTDWQNVVSTTTPAIEPQTRFRNLAGGWFMKSILPKTYYNLGNQTASQLCLVTNGGNPVGGWFEKEGKRVSGGPCADFFILLPIRRNAFANPFAVSVSVQPNPSVSINQTGSQLTANPIAGLTFQWLLNGQPIVGATGQGFTVNQSGSYQVVATNNQNCRDTSNVILITSSQSLAQGNKGIQLYPNPVAKTLQIETNLPGMESAELEWFDLQGKRLFTETLHFENGKAELDLSSRNLPKALYPIRIQTPGGSEWRRVMKE